MLVFLLILVQENEKSQSWYASFLKKITICKFELYVNKYNHLQNLKLKKCLFVSSLVIKVVLI